MPDWKELEKPFAERLALSQRPVAVTFLDTEPSGVPKFSGTEPAGCSFWRLAAEVCETANRRNLSRLSCAKPLTPLAR